MDNEEENILYLRGKNDVFRRTLEKVIKPEEIKANNLNNIMFNCIKMNNFYYLYEYFTSEIEFNGGFYKFCEELKISPNNLRKVFHSGEKPDLILLTKILEGLGYRLKIVER